MLLLSIILKALESSQTRIRFEENKEDIKKLKNDKRKYYQEDDVFISLRNISTILHYRPSSNELIDLIEGPFIHQHDVDFLNDSTLALFNKITFKTYPGMKAASHQAHKDTNRLVNAGSFNNNIVSYNLSSKKFSFIGDAVFKKHKINTVNEGLMEFIDENTYLVEEQNPGLIWVIKK